MLTHIRSFLLTYFRPIWKGFLLLFVLGYLLYGTYATHKVTAVPATYWMNMYSHKDYANGGIMDYIKELRTGIPPLFSLIEITSYNTLGSSEWLFKGVYRKAILLIAFLPLVFVRNHWWEWLWCTLVGVVFVESILVIHPQNPQYYDVLLPAFLLLYILLTKGSLADGPPFFTTLAAFGAGFFLSAAELARPFMLALVPLLILFNVVHYNRKENRRNVLFFLLPLLLISGLWHAKLLYYNQGQIIWSNSSGTNLFRAWADFVDMEELADNLEEEAPPIGPGRWQNFNTQVHYRNSQVRKQMVIEGVQEQPGKALAYLWEKALVFTRPRVDMYDNNPDATVLIFYRIFVRGVFIFLPILLLIQLIKIVRSRAYFWEWEPWILGITAFLTLMPIIGERGEEARFVISVLPFLTLSGLYTIRYLHTGYNQYIAGRKNPMLEEEPALDEPDDEYLDETDQSL